MVACAETILAAAVVVARVLGGVAGPRERNALGWFSKHTLLTESPTTARLHGQSMSRLPSLPSARAVAARYISIQTHRRAFDDLMCSSGYELASSDYSVVRKSNGGRPRRHRPAASLCRPGLLGTGEGE